MVRPGHNIPNPDLACYPLVLLDEEDQVIVRVVERDRERQFTAVTGSQFEKRFAINYQFVAWSSKEVGSQGDHDMALRGEELAVCEAMGLVVRLCLPSVLIGLSESSGSSQPVTVPTQGHNVGGIMSGSRVAPDVVKLNEWETAPATAEVCLAAKLAANRLW